MSELKLSTKEWEIYNFIKNKSANNLWTAQKEIQSFMEQKYGEINLREIRQYIYNIRHCEMIQKVILTSYTLGYKILSNEDQFSILEKRKKSILKMLKQYYFDVKRLNNNNQMKITFSDYERSIFESFIKVKED